MHGNGSRNRLVIVGTLCCLLISALASAQIDADEVTADMKKAVAEFRSEHPNAEKIMAEAEGVLVCPNVREIALIFGFERGICVLDPKGSSNYTYYAETGLKAGLAAGAASHSLILAFNDQAALNKFASGDGEWEIGVDADVAVAKKGASGSLDTTNLRSPVVAYVFGEKGLMADVSLNGSRYQRIDDIDIIDAETLVRVSALGKLRVGGGDGGRMIVEVNRWATEAERMALRNAIRDQGAMAGVTKAKGHGIYGYVKAPGMDDSVPLRYAYAVKTGADKWRLVLATTEPLGFVSSWAESRGADHDLSVILLDVDEHHNGTGELFLGTALGWDSGHNTVAIDQRDSVTVDLTEVTARN